MVANQVCALRQSVIQFTIRCILFQIQEFRALKTIVQDAVGQRGLSLAMEERLLRVTTEKNSMEARLLRVTTEKNSIEAVGFFAFFLPLQT